MSKKTFKLAKLIRDKTHQMLIDENLDFTLTTLESQTACIGYFKEKLLEEAFEVEAAHTEEELVLELADCLEVIYGFANALNMPYEKIEKERIRKRNLKGGFDQKIVVDTVTAPSENPWYTYYSDRPHKYPEVRMAKLSETSND